MSDCPVRIVRNTIKMKLQSAEEIEEFENSTDEILKAIAPEYRGIFLSGQQCERAVARQLCRFIPHARNLRMLNIHDCFDNSDNVYMILRALLKNLDLKDLDLDLTGCVFDVKCAEQIDVLLKTDRISSLRFSHLSSDDYMEDILKAFKKNGRKMKEFGLHYCALNSASVDYLQTILKKGRIERTVTVKNCYSISKGRGCRLPKNTIDNFKQAIKASKESPEFCWELAFNTTIQIVYKPPNKWTPVKRTFTNLFQESSDFFSMVKRRLTGKRKCSDSKGTKVPRYEPQNDIVTLNANLKKLGDNGQERITPFSPTLPNGPHTSSDASRNPTIFVGDIHNHLTAKTVNVGGTSHCEESESTTYLVPQKENYMTNNKIK